MTTTIDDITAAMREQAHEIALKRRKEWWDGLTNAERRRIERQMRDENTTAQDALTEFKPGVIVLDPDHTVTPYVLQMQLILHDIFMPLEELAGQTQLERDKASLWCATVMLNASDNDVVIAPRPEWLPARDSSGWEHGKVGELVRADIDSHGGNEEARLKFDVAFKPAASEVVPALRVDRDYEGDPFWARQLRGIADTLLEIAGGDRRMVPDDLVTYGEWIHGWLDNGAPTLEPAPDAEQEPTDTSVDRDNSERSTDGNDSKRRLNDVWSTTEQ